MELAGQEGIKSHFLSEMNSTFCCLSLDYEDKQNTPKLCFDIHVLHN